MPKLTPLEQDRFVEVMFFLYFDRQPKRFLENKSFWTTIYEMCKIYDIDPVQISKAARALMLPNERPSEVQIYYLLHKMGFSVRDIKHLSGIYWQKQQNLSEAISKYGAPTIKRTVTDTVAKHAIRVFLTGMSDIFGVLSIVDREVFENFF